MTETKQPQKKVIKTDPTEHEMWVLFWDYHEPILLKKHHGLKTKANLPKDPFELATYKIIEMKFYTERYTSYYEPKIDHSATKI